LLPIFSFLLPLIDERLSLRLLTRFAILCQLAAIIFLSHIGFAFATPFLSPLAAAIAAIDILITLLSLADFSPYFRRHYYAMPPMLIIAAVGWLIITSSIAP